jgi:hypothetical protein
VAAQDDSYQAALGPGDLSSLVPAAFADAEDMTVATLAQSMPPAEMDTDAGAVAREDLAALLEAAGVTLADAQSYTGIKVDGEQVLTFSADRFPGSQPRTGSSRSSRSPSSAPSPTRSTRS